MAEPLVVEGVLIAEVFIVDEWHLIEAAHINGQNLIQLYKEHFGRPDTAPRVRITVEVLDDLSAASDHPDWGDDLWLTESDPNW